MLTRTPGRRAGSLVLLLLLLSLTGCSHDPASAPAPHSTSDSTPSPQVSVSPHEPASPRPPDDHWKPDLVDHFDTLRPGLWHVKNFAKAANESSFLLARNVSTADGVLRIQAKHESAGGRRYTSGRMDTNGTYALPNYFRAEVRAKVPLEHGMWAAPLWFRPVNGGAGEIDLVETYGAEQDHPKVHQAIHAGGEGGQVLRTVATSFSTVARLPATDWHTYTIEKTPGHVEMWVDGTQTVDFTAASAPWFNRYYEAGKQWNLRVNLQVGGTYGPPDSTTKWSGDGTTMQVDYIKTWIPR